MKTTGELLVSVLSSFVTSPVGLLQYGLKEYKKDSKWALLLDVAPCLFSASVSASGSVQLALVDDNVFVYPPSGARSLK